MGADAGWAKDLDASGKMAIMYNKRNAYRLVFPWGIAVGFENGHIPATT